MENRSTRSTAELFFNVADDVRALVRKELELARLELTQSVKQALKGAGLIAAAVAAVVPGLVFLIVALALWLPVGEAAGFAIVGGTLFLMAGLGVMLGMRKIRKASKPEQAIQSVKENVRWARERMTH